MSDTRATKATQPSRSSRDPILEVRGANVSFNMDRGTSNVLDNVSIDVDRDEILGVVGESGSGKSMFASALIDAVVEPGQLEGEVTYHPESGEPVDVLSLPEDELKKFRWEEISMVFQGAMSSFNPTTKIETHFLETLRAHRADVEDGMERARELLSDLYLEPDRILESYPHELSGGMKQRALIALSLILEPEVVVMDEPTAALDLLMQRSIIQLMRNLQEKYDLTLVFITHDLALVAELADRLAVMYAFGFVEQGPANEIIQDPSHPYTRALIKSMPNLDVPVDEMRPIEGSAPDPVNVPSGCSYHPRCPIGDEHCKNVDPNLRDVDDDHQVACHYWETAMDEINLEFETGTEGAAQTNPTSSSIESSSDTKTVVSLKDIEVHFSEGGGLFGFVSEPEVVQAVDGVSVSISERDVVALVGESGCGKTTLGKTAVGLQRPTSGTLKYRGEDVWEARDGQSSNIPYEEIRRALQIIHQDPGSSLNPYQRIKSILSEPLRKWYSDLTAEARLQRIYSMLALVGMEPPEDYADRYPHQLSGGEKQRVALVRALLMNPDLILADEAVSALDVSLRIEMMDLFLEMQNQFDTSYLFISHDLSNARYLVEKSGGRIGIMYLGNLVEIGTPKEILEDPIHPYTKALRWASPDLGEGKGQMPLRTIDIPDPVNPPSGCRFHTRCPEARAVCTRENPDIDQPDNDRKAACFRANEDHEYWQSESIVDDDYELSDDSTGGS